MRPRTNANRAPMSMFESTRKGGGSATDAADAAIESADITHDSSTTSHSAEADGAKVDEELELVLANVDVIVSSTGRA